MEERQEIERTCLLRFVLYLLDSTCTSRVDNVLWVYIRTNNVKIEVEQLRTFEPLVMILFVPPV